MTEHNLICPQCKQPVKVIDETVCTCGYFFKVKSREVYKWEAIKIRSQEGVL